MDGERVDNLFTSIRSVLVLAQTSFVHREEIKVSIGDLLNFSLRVVLIG